MIKFIVKRIKNLLYVVDNEDGTAVSGPYTDNYQAADEAGKMNVSKDKPN